MPNPESLLRSAYSAFNARDIEAALELMHPEVDWPNAWEGGRVMITRMDVLEEPKTKRPRRTKWRVLTEWESPVGF